MPKENTPVVAAAPAQRTARQGGSRLSLRNWKLRSKLALVLAIPTVTALALGGLRAYDELHEADQLDQTTAQVELAGKVTEVVHQLQAERMLAVAKIITPSDVDLQSALNAQIGQVDSSVSQLRNASSAVEIPDPASRQRYEQGLQRLDALPALRTTVNTPPYSEQAAFTTYTSILDSLVQLGREVTATVSDRELLREGTTVQAISEAKEFYAEQDAALEIAAMRNGFTNLLLDQARAAQSSSTASVALFKASASAQQLQQFNDTVSGPQVDGREQAASVALTRAANDVPPGIDRNALAADSTATLAKMRTLESSLLSDMRANSAALANSATTAAWRDIAIVLAALVLALLLTFFVARVLLRPLRVLRTSALEIAYTRLPQTVNRILDDPEPMEAAAKAVEPVPVYSREEIGQVARSFDEVHEQAVKMAAEQALLRENVNGIFVNLSRRSQRLVERQLGVIDRLEADEQDPDHLASLFELDHLATRLRRNGESLLVLSGAGLAKSVPKPVSAADVIGAAVSEIEQYARVEVGVIPEVAVRGLTVHDLVHLLAELLDNATYFSEPETKVTVRAVITRRKALAIQITDRGVGMSEEQLAEANQRLADPPDLDVSVTRRMGLYVVARLAQRHGIEVRVRENEDIDGGIIARVVVPAELLGPVVADAPMPPSQVETSMPQIPAVPAQRPRPASIEAERTQSFGSFGLDSSSGDLGFGGQQPQTPQPQAGGDGGLTPLAQPISLDDLVAGSSSAAFLSRGSASPKPPSNGLANGLARGLPSGFTGATNNGFSTDSPGNGSTETFNGFSGFSGFNDSQQGDSGGTRQGADQDNPGTGRFTSLELPKREPQYVPVTKPEEPEEPNSNGVLDDDAPTKRLPIYQSVVSRWFSEEADGEQPQQDTRGEEASDDPMTGDLEGSAGGEEQAEPRQEESTPMLDDVWRSAADEGWSKAQSLLEPKGEETTTAGLPKRVPNAYLMPGSVGSGSSADSAPASFVDTTSSRPGQSAVSRSATAARERMVSFQKGYRSGRHALADRQGQSVSVSGGDLTPPEYGSEE